MEEVFGPVVEGRDGEACERIKSAIERLAGEHSGAEWFVPMGIGGHVDHLAVRNVTMECVRTGRIAAGKVRFYEDLPYAAEQQGPVGQNAEMKVRLARQRLEVGGVIMGNVLPAGLSSTDLTGDMTVKYQVLNGGNLKNSDIVFAVPEPAALGLIGLGAMGLLARRRRGRARA